MSLEIFEVKNIAEKNIVSPIATIISHTVFAQANDWRNSSNAMSALRSCLSKLSLSQNTADSDVGFEIQNFQKDGFEAIAMIKPDAREVLGFFCIELPIDDFDPDFDPPNGGALVCLSTPEYVNCTSSIHTEALVLKSGNGLSCDGTFASLARPVEMDIGEYKLSVALSDAMANLSAAFFIARCRGFESLRSEYNFLFAHYGLKGAGFCKVTPSVGLSGFDDIKCQNVDEESSSLNREDGNNVIDHFEFPYPLPGAFGDRYSVALTFLKDSPLDVWMTPSEFAPLASIDASLLIGVSSNNMKRFCGIVGHVDSGKTDILKVLKMYRKISEPDDSYHGACGNQACETVISSVEFDHEGVVWSYADLCAPLVAHIDGGKNTFTGYARLDETFLVKQAEDDPIAQAIERILLDRYVGASVTFVAMNSVDHVDDEAPIDRFVKECRDLLTSFDCTKPTVGGSDIAMIVERCKMLHIDAEAGRNLLASGDGDFLMPIEDVFSISGVGTVATGSVEHRAVSVDDLVEMVDLRYIVGVRNCDKFSKLLDRGGADANTGALLRDVLVSHRSHGSTGRFRETCVNFRDLSQEFPGFRYVNCVAPFAELNT